MALRPNKKNVAKTDETSEWLDRPIEAIAVDDKKNYGATNRDRWRRRAILGCVFSVPVCALFMMSMFSGQSSMQTKIDEANAKIKTLESRPVGGVSKTDDSPGRYAAYQAIASWLAASPSPLPGGKVLYWTGSQSVSTKSKSDVRTIETFALAGGDGKGYLAGVEVAIDPRGGAEAMAGPSLTIVPSAAGDDWTSNEQWPGIKASDTIPTSIPGAVSTWATAYTSGNPQSLGLAVGDPNTAHTYQPISGATSVKAEVKNSARLSDGNYIARVEMNIKWANGDEATSSAPIVMDVLIKNGETAAPQITAWGAPGSGPALKAYQNATTLPLAANIQPSASASASPSASLAPAASSSPESK